MTDPTDPTEPDDETVDPVTDEAPEVEVEVEEPQGSEDEALDETEAADDIETDDEEVAERLMADALAPPPRRNGFSRLYHGETNVDIVGRWKLWFAISGVFLLVGMVALIGNGLNLGIDFTGGTVWEVPAGKADVADVESAMNDLGYDDVQVQLVTQNTGSGDERVLRVEAEATASPAAATTKALDQAVSDLGSLASNSKVKGTSKTRIEAVQANLEAVTGPFRQAVPEPLKALQTEIDDLDAAIGKSNGSRENIAKLVKPATEEMQKQVSALDALEQTERERVGQKVSDELARLTGSSVKDVTVDTVGPSWGEQISNKARTALVVFLIVISIYITLRFEFRMAVATLAALVHDLLIVVGIYAIFQFPVTPATVIALLTILGFSIYDGIVVFDRVDENTKLLGRKAKMTYTEMANLSLNQVLMRSLNTSITALLPIFTVLVLGSFVLGATTLEEFGLALFLGLLSGAYSSIFIATPMLALLKEREPKYRDLRARLAQQSAATAADGSKVPALKDTGAPVGAAAPRPRKSSRSK